MWQCLPVPAFGKITSSVRFATVGLNPSWSEFWDEKVWKERSHRLPVVQDFGVRQRLDLEEDQLEDARRSRESYFADGQAGLRTDHAWFGAFKELLRECWDVSYGEMAVHIDLVACPTWHKWGKLGVTVQRQLLDNCQRYFRDTVLTLPAEALVLLDGDTVLDEVRRLFPAEVETFALPSGVELVTWQGAGHDFIGWRDSIWSRRTRSELSAWIAAEFGGGASAPASEATR
jgi:hypothetical protein